MRKNILFLRSRETKKCHNRNRIKLSEQSQEEEKFCRSIRKIMLHVYPENQGLQERKMKEKNLYLQTASINE